jgi:L-iditol 2-dehydrogenase
MCAALVSRGYTIDGAFAEFINVEERSVWRLPPELALREAALCEPLAGAVHALTERVVVHAGDTVLISGPGPVGLLCVILAKLHGATVFLCGTARDERRLALGKELGADCTLNVDAETVDRLLESTPRAGVDVAVEAAGVGPSLANCLKAVRKGGAVVQAGIFGQDVQADLAQVVMKELCYSGSYGYLWSSWDKSLRLLAAKCVPAPKLISEELPLAEWERGFALMASGEAVKVLLRPNAATQ